MKTPDAFYRVSYHISVAGEANTFAETRIKHYEVEMAICVHGERSKKKLATVQLSNNTVKSHSEFVSRYRKTIGILAFARYLFQNKTEEDF
jgi:hypothetical protein